MKLSTSWNRDVWAVVHTSPTHDDAMVLGEAWHANRPDFYPGEQSRMLAFRTRADARAWCYNKMKEYEHRTDFVAKWRFRPMKLRIKVTAVNPQGEPTK